MRSKLITIAVEVVRRCTGPFLFKKRLPAAFGGAKIFVTSRADIRILRPGWQGPAGDLMTVVEKYIHQNMVVWDAGSNLGILSFCAAYRAGTSGAVYTIEADPKYAEIQNKTTKLLPSNYASVTPLCAAVSDEIGMLSLIVPRNGHARNHLSVVQGNSADVPESQKAVVTVTLDFLRRFWPAPGFLKIDVEGAEIMVLKGAREILETERPIIYIEVNQENSEEATSILKAHSYELFTLNELGQEIPCDICSFNTLAKPRAR